MKPFIFQTCLGLGFLAAIASSICFFLGIPGTALALMLCFICLALGFQGFPILKGFSYTLFIFAASTYALNYPENLVSFQGYLLKKLVTPLLVITMFGMGIHMNLTRFVEIVKAPKPILAGIFCHYFIMPGIGFGLAMTTDLPPEIAAGIILVGCSPSGVASNVMAYISGGNLALSVTVTAISTLLAPLVTPLLMKLLANQLVPINFWDMFWHILEIVIFPVLAGLVYNKYAYGKQKWLDDLLPILSMASIIFIVALTVSAGHDTLLSIGWLLILIVIVHNLSGYFFGYKISKWMGINEQDSRTIAFEVGLQNAGLATGIAAKMGFMATMGLVPGIFGSMQNITASVLANWWGRKK
ncbi:bile acid:sodium symporter family protein [Aquirufa regiilacus]